MGRPKAEKVSINEEQLWEIVLHGSAVTAAMALVILDDKYKGKIIKFFRENDGQ